MVGESEVKIVRVGAEAHGVIANLFELYMHDMAEWFQFDIGTDGRYGYDLNNYWQQGDRAYLAWAGDALAGFALVGAVPDWLDDQTGNDVAEFFVLRRHRHRGVADRLARTIWDEEPGRWCVRVFEGNVPAVPFWRRIVAAYADNDYTEARLFNNERAWVVFRFGELRRGLA